jgi:thiopurine S-methyltransferase
VDDLDFWHEAWDAGIVASRVKRPDNTLEMHWPSLKVAQGSRVLVPLSGKSGDLAWLASTGYVPVGVEVSEIPCQEFFAERGVRPDRTPHGPFVKWHGSGVTILQGDFYDLADTYDAAIDRGALVAVSPSSRRRYAGHLNARMTPGAPILLVVIEYDPALHSGPPYPVFADEVQRLFPGSVELGRGPMQRRKWQRIGGADAVVWAARAKAKALPG